MKKFARELVAGDLITDPFPGPFGPREGAVLFAAPDGTGRTAVSWAAFGKPQNEWQSPLATASWPDETPVLIRGLALTLPQQRAEELVDALEGVVADHIVDGKLPMGVLASIRYASVLAKEVRPPQDPPGLESALMCLESGGWESDQIAQLREYGRKLYTGADRG